MRCGVTKSIPWVSEGAGRLCGHSVGYPLARTAHHETMAVLAAAHPTYVIAAIHRRCTLSCPCLPMLGRCSTPPIFISKRCSERTRTEYLRSVGFKGSRPRDAAM